jgi:peptidyl-prolyl cis-trans isomerase B (cyclophilin B)
MNRNFKRAAALLSLLAFFAYGCASSEKTETKETQTKETETEKTDTSKTETSSEKEDADTEESETKATGSVEEGQMYEAVITVKDYGTITFTMNSGTAPETVENFVSLANSGFYDGLTFHRIMDGFMIQGGDPKGNGTGGSARSITGEFSANGFDNTLSHVRGTVSMARSNDPDSASSQFFIVQEDSTFLDGNYAAFGTVTSGMDVVDQIVQDANPTDSNGTITASEQPVIESITVTEIN